MKNALAARWIIHFFYTIRKEGSEHLLGFIPVFPVDAVTYFRRFYLPVDKPYILQHLQVLRDGSPGDAQYLMEGATVTIILTCQKPQDSEANGVRQNLGYVGHTAVLQLLFFRC
jgi:hypothetical protein